MKNSASKNFYVKEAAIIMAALMLCLLINSVSLPAEDVNRGSETPVVNPLNPESENSGDGRENEPDRESLIAYQMVFTTLPVAFGIIHLVLFLFIRKKNITCGNEDLYFALFLFVYGAAIFADYQMFLVEGAGAELLFKRIHRVLMPFVLITALRFIYSLFRRTLPLQFWVLFGLTLVAMVFSVINPDRLHIYLALPSVLCTLEMARIITGAVRKKEYGAWLVALGFSIYFVLSLFDAWMDWGRDSFFSGMENPYAIGGIGFLVTMSIYLARNYARLQEQLLLHERRSREMEIERRLLEAEHARKTRELEDARKLQLSMLPSCIGTYPGLDLCFHMDTATEVGGDYYDYLEPDDDSLVLTVGDATGHGLKAGIMVASVKSLFRANAAEPDPVRFFERCTSTIKQMNMGNLYMALMLARFKGKKLVVASAGMPPLLIHRQEEKCIEEVVLKGPPLGGFKGYPYSVKELELRAGDALLFMSDGLAELFNEDGEMLGYGRVKEFFLEAAGCCESADDISDYLCNKADEWRKGRDREDDMTLVVIKVTH